MEICKLEHIRKDYKMGEVVTPLKDLTLTVCEGDFIAVEGPSGIGKSTLLLHLQAYLYQKGEYDPKGEMSFAPALCNRIDRNTGGIVIAAKCAEALRVMNEKIKLRYSLPRRGHGKRISYQGRQE